MFFNFSLYILLVGLFMPLVLFLINKKMLIFSIKNTSYKNDFFLKYIIALILIFVTIYIILNPLSHFFPIPGGDAVMYISSMNNFKNFGFLWMIQFDGRPLITIILSLINLITNDFRISLAIFLLISGWILVFSVFLICKKIIKSSYSVSLISSLISIFLPTTLWYLGDLYANFFTFSLFFLYLYIFIDYKINKSNINLVYILIILLFISLSHFESFILLALINIFFFTFNTIYEINILNERKIILNKYVILLFITLTLILCPFIITSLISINYYGPFSKYLGNVNDRYGTSFFNNGSIPSSIEWHFDLYWGDQSALVKISQIYGKYQNIILFLLSSTGIFILNINNKLHRYLYSWCSILILLIIFSYFNIINIPAPARLSILLPFPILTAVSLNFIEKKLEPILIDKNIVNFNCISLLKFIMFFIIIIDSFLIANNIEKYYFSSAQIMGAPSNNIINNINIIKEKYGYGNKSIIIITDNNEMRKSEWVYALTGDYVYQGSLAYLINNKTIEDPKMVKPDAAAIGYWNILRINNVFKNISKYTIIVIPNLYNPNNVEYNVLTKIGENIYIIKPENINSIYLWNNS